MKRNPKRFLSAVLTLIMLLTMIPLSGLTSFAAISGDFEYSVLSEVNKTCEITEYTGSAENLVIPSVINGYTVKSIGRVAFQHCYSLTSIVIPNGVTSIGDLAFLQCSELISITIPDSVTSIGYSAFAYCFSLESITIPDGVTSIGDETFDECYALKSVSIPNSVTSIGLRAFNACFSLANITIPDSVTYIGGAAFYETAYYNNADNWENDVLYIGHYLIDAKNTISGAYTVKPETKIIAGAAFWYCTSLTSVTIPNSVTDIYDNTFYGCTSLTSVTIPNSVTDIYEYAFYGCTSLTSVTIPNSVIEIGNYAFGYYYSENGTEKLDGFTMYGVKGSAAETYATENEFTFVALDSALNGNLYAEMPSRAVIGQTVNIPVCVDGNTDLGALDFTVQYDKTKLEYVSCNEIAFQFSSINSNTPGELIVSSFATISVPVGRICVLQFNVIASSAGETNLTFSVQDACDGTYLGNPLTLSGGTWTLPIVRNYTITYNANGGTGAPSAQTKYTGESFALSSIKPTRTGYTFLGWATSANATAAQYAPSGTYTSDADVTLYAVWKPNTYTVKYNANGGTGTTANSSHTYDTAKALTANGFSRTGYTFLGWSTNASATSATYTDKQSVKNLTSTNGGTVTLYAVWKPNTYTVKYNANGGTGTTANSSHTYDTAKALTANGFTRTGYTFLGWSTNASATSATYTDKQSVKNLTSTNGGTVTLYAVWQKNPVTVSSISVQTLPTKTTYTVGDKFDASGLSIKATMSDGTTKTLTSGFTVSAPDMTTAGTKTVTVSYGGKTTTFNITVKSPVPPADTAVLRLDAPARAVVGQKIQIPIVLDKASLGTLMFTVQYDHTKLKYISYADSAFDMCDINSATAGIIKAACIDNSAVPAGEVIVLTFEVIAPTACSTNLALTVEEAYDGGDKSVSIVGGTWKMQIIKSIPGDVNGDGQVTAIDARWALQAASGTRELTGEQNLAADVNGDGKITAIDARWILQAASGTREL